MRTIPPRARPQRTALVTAAAAASRIPSLRFGTGHFYNNYVTGADTACNDLGGAATGISRVGTFTSPPYGHTAESASTVAASVTGGAGAGKL